MKKVLVFGTFDGLHPGHIDFLKQARALGDYLVVVVVARDITVKKIKNRLPQRSEIERVKDLQQSRLANKVKLGGTANPYDIIKEIAPAIIALGYDQQAFTDDLPSELKKAAITAQIIRLKPFKPEIYHSSLIKKDNFR